MLVCFGSSKFAKSDDGILQILGATNRAGSGVSGVAGERGLEQQVEAIKTVRPE
jgi:hypothetical protein